MFDTFGKSGDTAGRKENTLKKLARLNAALRHQEPDRVPISDDYIVQLVREHGRYPLQLAEFDESL